MNLRGWRAREAVCERGDHPWEVEDLLPRVPTTYDGHPALAWIEVLHCPWCDLRWHRPTLVEVLEA